MKDEYPPVHGQVRHPLPPVEGVPLPVVEGFPLPAVVGLAGSPSGEEVMRDHTL